jgi:hypothetical protein
MSEFFAGVVVTSVVAWLSHPMWHTTEPLARKVRPLVSRGPASIRVSPAIVHRPRIREGQRAWSGTTVMRPMKK